MRELRARFLDLNITADGGLNPETCQRCFDHRANVFDIGSKLFKPPNMAEEIRSLRKMSDTKSERP